MTKPNVLVTGGAGYIGSHAVLALKDAGWNVAVIDDLSNGSREVVPEDLLEGVLPGPGSDDLRPQVPENGPVDQQLLRQVIDHQDFRRLVGCHS